GRQVDDVPVAAQGPGQRVEVAHVAPDHAQPGVNAGRLQVPGAAGAEVVIDGHALDARLGQQAVDDVAADEPGPAGDHVAAAPDAHRTGSAASDSQRGAACRRAGWETSRCHTTAAIDSVWGVTRSAKSGGMTTAATASRAAAPPSRPAMA